MLVHGQPDQPSSASGSRLMAASCARSCGDASASQSRPQVRRTEAAVSLVVSSAELIADSKSAKPLPTYWPPMYTYECIIIPLTNSFGCRHCM